MIEICQWYIPNEIIYVRFSGEATVEEMSPLLQTIYQMQDQSTRPLVHFISDNSRITKALGSKEMLKLLSNFKPHSRAGWNITIGEKDKLLKFTSNIARQILHLRTRSFDTFDETIDFLRTIDETIDWSKADQTILPKV